MTEDAPSRDLIVLVADKNMEHAIHGLFTRCRSMNIRQPVYDIFVHIGRDPGCFFKGHDFLRQQCARYRYALIVFDLEGCGRESLSREILEQQVEDRMNQSGWNGRNAVIAIDPELESWVWSNSPHVEDILGWKESSPTLQDWLLSEGFLATSSALKPHNPKKAVEDALRVVRKQRSSSIYRQLAERVTLTGCIDEAFLKFRRIMSEWFGAPIAE